MRYVLGYEEVQDILREYLIVKLARNFDKETTTFDWLGLDHDSLEHQPAEILISPENDD